MVKRSIEQDLRNENFGARSGNYERNSVVKNQGTKQRGQRSPVDCWQWEFNGQCSKGDNCSFRHDVNKHARMTQPNPSPKSFMQQDERKTSRTRSLRGKSPSGRMSRWPCKDTLQNACSTRPRVVADLVKSARMHIVRVMNNLEKGPKRMMTKSAVAMLKKHELYDRTGQPVVGRDTRHLRLEGHGAAKVVANLMEELRHTETNPTCEIHESCCTSH